MYGENLGIAQRKKELRSGGDKMGLGKNKTPSGWVAEGRFVYCFCRGRLVLNGEPFSFQALVSSDDQKVLTCSEFRQIEVHFVVIAVECFTAIKQ